MPWPAPGSMGQGGTRGRQGHNAVKRVVGRHEEVLLVANRGEAGVGLRGTGGQRTRVAEARARKRAQDAIVGQDKASATMMAPRLRGCGAVLWVRR